MQKILSHWYPGDFGPERTKPSRPYNDCRLAAQSLRQQVFTKWSGWRSKDHVALSKQRAKSKTNYMYALGEFCLRHFSEYYNQERIIRIRKVEIPLTYHRLGWNYSFIDPALATANIADHEMVLVSPSLVKNSYHDSILAKEVEKLGYDIGYALDETQKHHGTYHTHEKKKWNTSAEFAPSWWGLR